MKVYVAICHSNAYYDDYIEERVIDVYKDRDNAINGIFRDMVVYNLDGASYEDLIKRCNNLDKTNEEGLYEIIETELK